ncbi:MAG TPA: hypothetical protein PK720_00755 [bacterium]|jgi:hypothetical protein|nr:hypothetical protein [bacterium]
MKNLKVLLRQLLSAKYSILLISGLLAAMVIVPLVLVVNHQVSQSVKPENKVENRGITSDYNAEAKAAVSDYQDFLKGEKSEADIKNRRDYLLSLKISKENQALHLSLVMIADNLLASRNDLNEKNRVQRMLTTLITDHPILSN